MRRREARAGLLFVLPWLLGLLIFTAYPVLASI
jgi:multiple sugar transport system permease protein